MRNKSILILLLSLFLSPFVLHAQDYNMYEQGNYVKKFDILRYRILFPDKFDPTKKYPLVFVLHGTNERGDDNRSQLNIGASMFLQIRYREKYPAIVVFPQCPKGDSWSNTDWTKTEDNKLQLLFEEGGEPSKTMSMLLETINGFLDKPFVDKHRVYLGGWSNGGMGTYELLRRRPDIFAAAFVISGGDNPNNARVYARKVPLWIFHGEKDPVVIAKNAEAMVVAIKEAGGQPKFTLYSFDDHTSWDDAFADPNLVPWLFSHKK